MVQKGMFSMTWRAILVALLVAVLGLAGCSAERRAHGDPGTSPAGGWKDRGPLKNPGRHLEVNLCQWYGMEHQPGSASAGVSNVAIHLTNFSSHDLGAIELSFRIYSEEQGKRLVLKLDDYLPAHGSLYTHIALDGNSRVYPGISAKILGARVLATPGS